MSAVFLVEEVIANGGSTEGLPLRPATAPVVEAALVQHAGEAQPGLVLEDGSVVVLSFAQMHELRRAFDEWSRMFLRGPSTGRMSMRVPR